MHPDVTHIQVALHLDIDEFINLRTRISRYGDVVTFRLSLDRTESFVSVARSAVELDIA